MPAWATKQGSRRDRKAACGERINRRWIREVEWTAGAGRRKLPLVREPGGMASGLKRRGRRVLLGEHVT